MTVICDFRWGSGLLAGRPGVAAGRERGSMPWTVSLHGAAGPVRGLLSSNKAPVRRSAGRWAARAPQRRAGFRAVRPWERGIAPVVLCSHGRACASSGRTRQSVHGLPEDGTNRMPFGVRRTADASASWTKGRRRGARLRGGGLRSASIRIAARVTTARRILSAQRAGRLESVRRRVVRRRTDRAHIGLRSHRIDLTGWPPGLCSAIHWRIPE